MKKKVLDIRRFDVGNKTIYQNKNNVMVCMGHEKDSMEDVITKGLTLAPLEKITIEFNTLTPAQQPFCTLKFYTTDGASEKII